MSQLKVSEEFREVMEVIYDEALIMALEENSISELTNSIEDGDTVIGASIKQLWKINCEQAMSIKDKISSIIRNNISNEWGDILEELEPLLLLGDECEEEEVCCNRTQINSINKIYKENYAKNRFLQSIFNSDRTTFFGQLYNICPRDKREYVFQDIMKLSELVRYIKKNADSELNLEDVGVMKKSISDWFQAVQNVRNCLNGENLY